MDIDKKWDGKNLTVKLSGRLDDQSSPLLLDALKADVDGLSSLEVNLCGVDSISESGLQMLLALHKQAKNKGYGMSVTNCNNTVMDVLNMTGFVDVFNIH